MLNYKSYRHLFQCTHGYDRLCLCSYEDNPDEPSDGAGASDISWREEEQASLRQSLRSLQTQFASERARRVESEREAELLAAENAALEHQVAGMEGYRVGVTSLRCVCWENKKTAFNVEFFISTSGNKQYVVLSG